ncbi:C-type lectin domain-containing protein [Caenorhabditis elegans]|uniref:C-type lectin domain-containing protein n=1 Tax=Caenorhabditis elegans TaxID=6239 RepID=Q60F71_CAEEL|nr:C-type lectin domain-containing protein [Caenorhabditis elegans]CCD83527.1 C-type lectin domain-containing protein [Caenorhabditis elegans]|eukprot:NP_001023504.1 C-type LECtin [Caenorhabditis elegans]
MKQFLLILLFFTSLAAAQQCWDSSDRLINGRCYKLVNQQLSYQDARSWCRYQNSVVSYLATVSDQITASFLASYAVTAFGSNEGSFWIGLSRSSSTYKWDDGTPLGWTNFNYQNSQDYVAESVTNAKWTAYNSETELKFVCSYYPLMPTTNLASSTDAPRTTEASTYWTSETLTSSST